MLIGNVGKDPDVRYYDADQAVAQLSLATTERGYTLPNGTKVPDRTDWHNVIFYRGLAKIVEKYVHKGDKIYVEGKVRYRTYDDQRGVRHNITEVYVDNMELLSTRVSPTEPQPSSTNTAPTTSTTTTDTDDANLPF